MRAAIGSALIVVILTLGPPARADDLADADQLFRDGNALAAAGKYADACPKLAASQKLDPAVGTQFNLADCYEHLGRTATAFDLFVDVARIARAAGKFEREKAAKERAAALTTNLARLRFAIKSSAPGLELKVDDEPIARDRWSGPIAVDPGEHTLTATAPGRTTWTSKAIGTAGTTRGLEIPELVDPNPRVDAKPAPSPPRRDEPAPTPASSARPTLAVVLGGVAFAGFVVGGIGGGVALSARSDGQAACASSTYHFHCPTAAGADAWNQASSAGTISTAGFVVGGVALAAAVYLWVTAPSKRSAMTTTPTWTF